jgi:hypothetical protein
MRPRHLATASCAALLAALPWSALWWAARPAPVAAQAAPGGAPDRGVTMSFFGTPGLLEMPSAISADDGEIAGTVSSFAGQLRSTFTVQVTPRFSASFRYAGIQDFVPDDEDAYYDRSFDLRYRFTDEGRLMPTVSLGLQDFLGTGVYSAEYLVATKTLGDSVRVTAGLGWGRLGTRGGFDNPLGLVSDRFETRPESTIGTDDTGGTPGFETFFRGDAAVFGGIEYAPTARLAFKAEYSSDDAYEDVNGEPLFDQRWPVNLGLAWRPLPGIQLQAAYMYGSELAVGATFTVNANDRPFGVGFDDPPRPVAVRADAVRAAQSWDRAALPEPVLRERLATTLAAEGITLTAVEASDRSIRIRYVNNRYRTEAQALGRAARVLTAELPPSIEIITLETEKRGIPLSAVTFSRSDLEALNDEVGGTAGALDRAVLADAGPQADLTPLPPVRDPFNWSLGPYFGFTLFDGNSPVDVTLGAELGASYRIRPNLVFSGAIRQRIYPFGEQDYDLITDEEVPVVRRNARLFGAHGGPVLANLQLAHYGRPGRDLYSRVSVGYLERQYGGISTELLWKPVKSSLGLGLELNYAVQRDFGQRFGFQDYEVATGHASAYYDFRNGFRGQVDAGRYLAGDWGATFSLDREWENGWSVGGYVTLTDIPFEDYGEGSFDKGVRLSVPIDFVLGRPTQRTNRVALSSLNRDGGERLRVSGRLYDFVRDGHYDELEDSWGRFWR